MSTRTSRANDSPPRLNPNQLDLLLQRGTSLREGLSHLHKTLAEEADSDGHWEGKLRERWRERDALASQIGRWILDAVANGARIEVHPAPTPTVVPAPASGNEIDVDPPINGVPADPAALATLAEEGLSPNWAQQRSSDARRRAVTQLVEEIGKPSPLRTRDDIMAAVSRLTASNARMDAWMDQPQDVQKALMGLVSSLARQIQDECEYGLTTTEDEALRTAFSRMTAWSRDQRPGFVPGLSRSNPPDHGSWLEDGRHWHGELTRNALPPEPLNPQIALAKLEEEIAAGPMDPKVLTERVRSAVDAGVPQRDPRLISLLTPHQSLLKGARGLKTLKGAVRDALKEEVHDAPGPTADTTSDEGVPDDWPLLHLTEGKHAVVLGGDPRPQAVERIATAFRLGKVEWESTDVRRVSALAERIRRNNVDLVVILRRFISHREQDLIRPACIEARVPVCVVDTGYGVTQIRLAMERFWSDLQATSTADDATQSIKEIDNPAS